MATEITVCNLQHRAFRLLEKPLFRKSETDDTPVLVVTIGDREAALPLVSFRAEMGITAESPDGLMLDKVVQALEFVSCLRPGDKLPPEVLTGGASWDPLPVHREIASARLRLQLVAWLQADGNAMGDWSAEPAELVEQVESPAIREAINTALDRAAEALGVANSAAVLDLIEDMSEEMAYIEALRDRLLGTLDPLVAKWGRLGTRVRIDADHRQSLSRVHAMGETALLQIKSNFDQVDALTGEVIATLRNAESQRLFVRERRDWLYRSLRGWDPVFKDWEGVDERLDEQGWMVLSRTYHFLAQRFMPVKELLKSQTKPAKPIGKQMNW